MDRSVLPIYVPSYRAPHAQRAILDQAVKDMLDAHIIEATTSPWNVPIFLVKFNVVSHPQLYPLPLLPDIIAVMDTRNKVFTTLDLPSGYWQVALDEQSKEFTVFSTPSWQWQFTKMPFGISVASLTFHRLVNHVLQGRVD